MKVSLIVAYNTQVDLTKRFLDSILQDTLINETEVEVILCHAYLTAAHHTYRAELSEHTVVTKYLEFKNIGFCNTMNEGLKQVSADSEYVIIIGNDSFSRGDKWIDTLIAEHKESGAVIMCPRDQNPMSARAHLIAAEDSKFYYCTMFPSIVWLIAKKDMDKIGMFDERFFGAGYYADDDYCRRVTDLFGPFKTVVSKQVILDHLCSQEGKSLNVTHQMGELCQIFKHKWEVEYFDKQK